MKAARPFLAAALGSLLISATGPAWAQQKGITLNDLSPGKVVNGFRSVSLYVDAADRPIGARFVHERSGFTFDLLQIQSVPQAFIWVNSFPTSDMGEPHTQEHLLLGKGNRGRRVAAMETMSLAGSNAFTQQWRTCYHFNTGAGADVFYQQLDARLDALLHPDYTDEEIRREVRNFGVTENPADGTLRLEEKGSVYNEMVSAFERSWRRLFQQLDVDLYGDHHPLSYISGGLPAAIRKMQPEDIRKFHRDHYHLANMGMVGSFPKEMPLAQILERTGQILDRVQPDVAVAGRTMMTEADLPKPAMAPVGTINFVSYPHKNAGQPGPVVFAWPATLELTPKEQLRMELFMQNIASEPGTNLYKVFIDSKSRSMDIGAKEIYGDVSDDQGHPVSIAFTDIPAANLTEEKLKQVRGKIMEEISRLATLPDGSPEIVEFNSRIRSRIVEMGRDYDKFVNSPPGFGFRNTGSAWMSHLDRLARGDGFRKSVTMKSDLDALSAEVAGGKNIWRDLVAKAKLGTTLPYAVAAKADPELLKQEEADRLARNAAEVKRLQEVYKIADAQEAIRHYKAQYDSTSAALEALAQAENPRFIDSPPLTLDDQLEYNVSTLQGNVKMVSSTFDNMTSGTVGLALRLDGVPDRSMVYLSILPDLLTDVGVIRNGKPVSYEQMTEQIRNEILSLTSYFSTNTFTGRAELVMRGAGNNAKETERAVDWMRTALTSPDWRPENLSRIRDVVDADLANLRNTMQGREESWVNNPSQAYFRQDSRIYLSTASFLTRVHNVHRLRWLLREPGTEEDMISFGNFIGALSDLPKMAAGRDEMKALLAALQAEPFNAAAVDEKFRPITETFQRLRPTAKENAIEAIKDIDLTLADIPDGSLAQDLNYLCGQIRDDLRVPPTRALEELNQVRATILHTGNARMFQIASKATQQQVAGDVRALIGALDAKPVQPAPHSAERQIVSRLHDRVADASAPVFVGLVNPNTGSGVFLNSASLTSYQQTDRESLLRFLAAKIFGGSGNHSVFMKTWGAGLAYSNGIGSGAGSGRMSYYAERCPELPQTLRFVTDLVKTSQPDEKILGEYTIAQAFGEFRSASTYESRGEAIAADLADGQTPEVVKTFRRALLDLRKEPSLGAELLKRKDDVYSRVLPGYNGHARNVEGSLFMVIGPEKQMALYEDYLKSTEGADTKLYRLYPRDFWITSDPSADAASRPVDGKVNR